SSAPRFHRGNTLFRGATGVSMRDHCLRLGSKLGWPRVSTNVIDGRFEATLRVRAVMLEVTRGSDAGARVRVESPSFVVGTGSSADLRLADDTVSREHLRLSLGPSGVRLRDEGSTNGTWAGTMRIHDTLVA